MDDNQTSSCCRVTSVTEHLQCTSEVPQKYAASTLVPSNPQLKVSPSTEETQSLLWANKLILEKVLHY